MTVNVARPRARRVRKSQVAAPPSMSIGEIDQTVFSCPACERPLALGARQCPGCNTRLINGIVLGKASTFIAGGLVVGLLVGAGLASLAFAAGGARTAATTPVLPVASAAPIASAVPLPSVAPGTGTGNGSTVTIPAATRTALTETVRIDAELATAAASLQAALAGSSFDAMEVARTLRSMTADSYVGVEMTRHLGAWDRAGTLADDLNALYAQVHATASAGLDASVRNVAAYQTAAADLVVIVGTLAELDDEARELADDAGLDLPAATH